MKTASCSSEMLERTPSPWPHPTDHHFASAACVLWKFGVCLQNANIPSRVNSSRHYQQKFERFVSWFACYLQAKLLRNNKHTWNVKRGSGEGRIKLKRVLSPVLHKPAFMKPTLKIVTWDSDTKGYILPHRHIFFLLKINTGEFPGGSVVRTLRSHCQRLGSVPGWGTKIPQAARPGLKTKINMCCNSSLNHFFLQKKQIVIPKCQFKKFIKFKALGVGSWLV